MNKTMIRMVAAVVVIGAGSFYGGMKYGQQSGLAAASQGNFRGTGGGGTGGARRGGPNGMGGDVASGEIISRDNKSITVKLRDGGSKIIFIADSTQVMKSISGTVSDLAVGDQVMSFGTANADGSITAKSIQIRPKSPSPQ